MRQYIENFIKIAKNLGWTANYKPEINEIFVSRPTRHILNFEFSFDTGIEFKEMAKNLENYVDYYNPEEIAIKNYYVKDSGLRELLDEAEEIKDLLKELSENFS